MADTHQDTSTTTTTSIVKSTRIEDAPEDTVSYGPLSSLPLVAERHIADVNYLIGRPFHIATVGWTATQTSGYPLATIPIPFTLGTIPQFLNLAKYYAYMRPSMELLIKVNGTPMHYGRIMASYGYPIEMPEEDPYVEANLYSMTNQPWVALSANSVKTAKLEIPYLSNYEFIPTQSLYAPGQAINYHYADLKVRVATPLLINGDGTPSIDISLYVVIRDPGFSGLSAGYDYTPQPAAKFERKFETEMAEIAAAMEVGSSVLEAVEKAKEGVLLSNVTSDLSSWFSKFTKIKYIGVPASIAAKITSLGSSILKSLGFDIPPDVTKNVPIYFRGQRLVQAEDISMAVPLAPFPCPYVVKDPSFIGASVDDYDIAKYCAHPMLIRTTKIDTSMTVGTVIEAFPVRPDGLSFFFGENEREIVPSRMAYLSRMFTYWRGSIRFHFSIIASRFHSARIRITWIMNPINKWLDNEAGIYPEEFLMSFPSVIFDVNGDSDISLTVPYHQPTEWLQVAYPDSPFDAYEANNGVILVTVVNSLISNDATSPPGIFMQTFVSAGPDLQFAQPTLEDYMSSGVVSRSVRPARSFKAESLDGFSSASLRNADAKPLAEYNSGSLNRNLFMSTNVISMKQLLNMGGRFFQFKSANAGNHTFTFSYDWDTNAFLYALPEDLLLYALTDNYSMNILPLKAYARGSFRLLLNFNSASTPTSAVVTYSQDYKYPGYDIYCVSTPGVPLVDFSSEGCHTWKRYSDTCIAVDIPYYNTKRCSATNPGFGNPRTAAIVNILCYLGQGETVDAYLCMGDDFNFAYDIPMPYLRLTPS